MQRFRLQVLLDGLGSVGGVVGDGDGQLHVVALAELGCPGDELLAVVVVVADGLVQVIDKDMGDIEVAGVQTADQALEHVNILDAVLLR